MAAAEYFGGTSRPPLQQHSSSLYPPARPQRASSHPSLSPHQPQQNHHPAQSYTSQSQHHPPPPYQAIDDEPKPNVHFAPTPSPLSHNRPLNPSYSGPDPYVFNQPNYQSQPNQHLAPYQRQYFPQNYQPQSQQPPYPSPYAHQPRPHRSSSDVSHPGRGYVSDPERHRRKHKDRPRRTSDRSRSTKTDGFLGAAGGGLIGDMIFPGLGTVGGAVVGWIGGKDYGKHRKWREEKRDRDQERWEQKYGHSSDRSTSHSRERRHNSHDRRKNRDS